MSHTLPYPWSTPTSCKDAQDTWKPDHYVSRIIEDIGKSTMRRYGLVENLSKRIVHDYEFKLALKNYCADFSSPLWSPENYANFRRSDIIPRGDLKHPPRKWYLTPRLDPEKDPARCLLICDQLTDLIAYCNRCHACPALFMLRDDSGSMHTHVYTHEGWRRKESEQLHAMITGNVFAFEAALALIIQDCKGHEATEFLHKALSERFPAGGRKPEVVSEGMGDEDRSVM